MAIRVWYVGVEASLILIVMDLWVGCDSLVSKPRLHFSDYVNRAKA